MNSKAKLNEIRIKDYFSKTTPREEKLEKYRKYWEENHEQLKPITINERNVLVDGYIQYLVLKENGVGTASVTYVGNYKQNTRKINKKSPTVYIYGVHPKSKVKKEFVWRVPDSWKGWENDLLPGDQILVRTNYGIKPIIVTRIEWLNVPPIDGKIKKVFKKF